MFVALLARLYGPVASFANVSVDITRSIALFQRLFNYFDKGREIKDRPDATRLKHIEGFIKFNNVYYQGFMM